MAIVLFLFTKIINKNLKSKHKLQFLKQNKRLRKADLIESQTCSQKAAATAATTLPAAAQSLQPHHTPPRSTVVR
jgi:hypothetical protein